MSEHYLPVMTLTTRTLQKKRIQQPGTVANVRINKRTSIRCHVYELAAHFLVLWLSCPSSGKGQGGLWSHGVADQGGLGLFVLKL